MFVAFWEFSLANNSFRRPDRILSRNELHSGSTSSLLLFKDASDVEQHYNLLLGLQKSPAATKLTRIAETRHQFLRLDTLPNGVDGAGLQNFDRIL